MNAMHFYNFVFPHVHFSMIHLNRDLLFVLSAWEILDARLPLIQCFSPVFLFYGL